MENRIYVSIPLDALIVSGITSDCAVQISAMDGAILIELCKIFADGKYILTLNCSNNILSDFSFKTTSGISVSQ